ncbi:CHAT domain-containing protein [Streptomyces sp. JV176]|uniref:CHAT domain-containing protein n=1 Tax=Streptomyces sp. JV176 TaxID=858630 RepID=UPI002E76502C|nr:CHAT domain-containing protein [Streptomyces sp. JV176]MEE1804295.1 CHAT domain-containing protein [Streptomyces sp. JV176]
MSQWAQALGALGALVMGLFGAANWRFPFLERYGVIGFGFGMLTWVCARFDGPAGEQPGWYDTLGSSAMLLVGVSRLIRSSRHRDSSAFGDDDHLLAAEADMLLRFYFKQDALPALDKAVDTYRDAVRHTDGAPPDVRDHAHLLKALRIRYERLRNRADLDEAVELGYAARTRRGTRSHRALLLTELSTALRLRHDHTGASEDLAQARDCGEAAVALLHPRHLLFPLCGSRLSHVLFSSYEHTGDPRRLDDALGRLRRGLDSAARRGYARTADEIRLCFLLTERGRRTGSAGDLAEAVATGDRTLARITPKDPLYASCLHHLSVAVRATGTRPEKAEDLARRALLSMTDGAPEQARAQLNHALALYDLHGARADPGRLDHALSRARSATLHPTADVPTRLGAGLVWSDIAAAERRDAEAVEAFESVIGLLPQFASQELSRADQEGQSARWAGVAVAAATSAVAAGEPAKAAVLLELGRGVLLSRTLALRTDATALRAAHPRLAAELDDVRGDLTSPAPDLAPEAQRSVRREREGRWERLLREIRRLPGFEDFARPPTADRLRALSADGPLIYLTVTARGSAAIAVTPDEIRAVPLRVTPEEVEERARALRSCFALERVGDHRAQGPAFDVLGWMWDELVAPALSAALPARSAPPPPGGCPPRVWWVPTGPLVELPLHAAGHHRDGGPVLLDRAVSSYTPTAHALAAARGRSGPALPGGSRLAVAVPAAEGHPPLPKATGEAELVARTAPGAVSVLTGADATRDRVLAELPRHAWAHFACHAVPDPATPSHSRLLLDDHQDAPLTVADISALDLRGSRLAYLSACETSVTGPRHRDEAIHFASAFQLAGFPHVISTLWQVPDVGAYGLAKAMYDAFEAAPDDEEVARAVHAVTRLARAEMCPKLPGVWSALAHVGP